MGLWGAAQGIAFGLGGLAGTAASDLARWLIAQPGVAYASVFALEALLFAVSAWLASRIAVPASPPLALTPETPSAAAVHPLTDSANAGLALASHSR